MSVCSKTNCNLNTWKSFDKCILHCPKGSYQDNLSDGTLIEFYKQFIFYILDKFKNSMISEKKELYATIVDNKNKNENDIINKFNEMIEYNTKNQNYGIISNLINKVTFIPKFIVFPHRDERDFFDYLKILKLFKEIHFDYCEFYETYLELKDSKVFFQNCVFHNRWSISNYKILDNIDNVIYQTCKFKKNVDATNNGDKQITILDHSQFDYTCIFEQGIQLYSVELKQQLFSTHQNNFSNKYSIPMIKIENCIFNDKFIFNSCKINKFYIINSIFKEKFYINKQYSENSNKCNIKQLKIENSTFEENFKLHNVYIDEVVIEDTDFNKHADFFMSIFKSGISNNTNDKSIKFKGLNFHGLALFGNCEFHQLLKFEYVTFENFTHFKRAKFINGLDLDYTNIQKEINFFNIKELDSSKSKEKTSRETYRIIKYNFQKIDNNIEANKYFALEQDKYYKELSFPKNIGTKFALLLNKYISNYYSSWIRVLFWIIAYALIVLVGYCYFSNKCSTSNTDITFLTNKAIELIDPLNMFKKDNNLYENHQAIGFIIRVISLYLFWQFIVAFRQNTKRK